MAVERPSSIVCDARSLAPDAVTVDVLARLQVTAGRLGVELRVLGVSSELAALIELCGLAAVLRVEPCGQTEERE